MENRLPTWSEVTGALFVLAGIAVYMLFDVKNSRLRVRGSRDAEGDGNKKADTSEVPAPT
ncbi:hypothetical protein GTX14_18365 [Streptomyces sp. SID4944]|nr:hypothetical protein [Streptomyces sp. SID4944]